MKRMIYAAALAILILTISVFVMEARRDNDQSGEPASYAKYIQRKLDVPFPIIEVEVAHHFHSTSDNDFYYKAYLSDEHTISVQELIGMGWMSSPLPEELLTEHVLEDDEPFDAEILSYSKEHEYLWFYRDDYFAFYQKKGFVAGLGTDYLYRSPNYTFCVYFPKCNLLYFRDWDS
jgi:hypothetical protein